MKKITPILFLILFVLLAACSGNAQETPEEAYAGYGEAAAAGAIERGWSPEWLPETAVDIREKHDLDSNASILVFDAGGSFVVPEGCDLAAKTLKASLSAGWWPAAEVAELPVYHCSDGLLATDETSSQVYFWRP